MLDVGCGDGELLKLLADKKAVDGRGVEISRESVNACVTHGLSVIQGDADRDLDDYPGPRVRLCDPVADVQATRHPKPCSGEPVRIGRQAIVSFPNFGHWSCAGSS